MKLTKNEWLRIGGWMELCLMVLVPIVMATGWTANAQAVSTTTVQGTVYLANGQPGAGTLNVSWPAFTTANGQSVVAGQLMVTIAADGFLSVNLSPNLGAKPAGLYYTAVYQMSDGTTSTQYWVVPAAAQASLGSVQAQLMPAAQAVQAVSKTYVDESITEAIGSTLTASGGTLSGPLYLNGDPTQPLQAADKHYVDTTFSLAVPLAGGNMTGPLITPAVNGVESPVAGSSQTTLQAAISAAGTNGAVEIPPSYAGTDGFTNPNGVYVTDLRTTGSQQIERSVKEFGAKCDGSTDDTNALQAAVNYAQTHGVALTIPEGICKTRTLNWHGESIGGLGKQVSALLGFPGQDVLATATDSTNLLSYTRLHDLTIYVDQSIDVSCSAAEGRAPAGNCGVSRLLEKNSIFSPGGNGLTGTAGTGTAWAVGNCAIAMPAATGAGGNGLRVASIENLEIMATGVDPMAAQYPGAHSTHTCGMYLAQWPQWSEFRNIDIRGLNTGIAIPTLPVSVPAGLTADSNRWQNITIQATHGFTAAVGSNNVLDNVVATASNSAATAEPPTGLVLDLASTQQGWTARNAVVTPIWNAVQPTLMVTASGGAVTTVTVGTEHGLGFDPYGTQVPLAFSGSCTAQAAASVNSNGSIGAVTVTSGGVGCSSTTTASVNAAGTWDTAAPVNLIGGQNMTFIGGNLLKGNGGYTAWNAAGSQSYGTQFGGGGTLPGGGSYAAQVVNNGLGTAYPADQFPGADFGAKLQACLKTVSATYGGTCDARNFTGNLSMGSNLTIATGNTTVLLPCATISTANQIIVTAGTRNVSLRGCALRGGSSASGSLGGTAFQYSGTSAMVQVGDPTYVQDTQGFHIDNVVINTTTAGSATAQGLAAYRTQEMYLESLYFLGNSNQTGMTLDGTGNYTGGTFFDNAFNGFQTAVNAVGHQISNPASTDWMNASTFVRLHIDCPTSGGSPISGSYGINLQQGDGNTFTGGDVEGCSTALHLGANAQNNTIVGLRNENSTNQVVADTGSSYNNWMTGGTMFTGALTDNGTRNSFLDTFHRSFNGLNGDWYGSQKDATVTNHYRLGIGLGNERGLLDRYQTDYGYRWTIGLSDATAGEQFYQVLDELNSVYRFSIGQYNNGQSSTNDQTVINAAGTGAIVLNGSNNSGTGGVVIGSGGASETTVATINNAGNALFNGTLGVNGISTLASNVNVKNGADAEVDYVLQAGLTTSQKESFIYKDWNGNSQWYMVKDASNNWALNSATGGLDSFKAYQSANSGDTYIDASNTSGAVRVNYETGSGTSFNIYGGNSSALYASFTGTTAIKFPGLAASSGHYCLQVDNSGFITNTGSACGTGSGSGSGTVDSGNNGEIAVYDGTGTVIEGGQPVEGTLYADQMQTPSGTGNNGIVNSLTECASEAYVCSIIAPALYAQVEAQPWGSGNSLDTVVYHEYGPKSTDPIGCVTDYRWGPPQVICNQGSPNGGSGRFNGSSPIFAQNITKYGTGLNAWGPSALSLQETVFSGSHDFNNDETLAIALRNQVITNSSTGSYNIFTDLYSYGVGDSIPLYTDAYSMGSGLAQNEGLEWRARLAETGNVFQGTLNSETCGAACIFSAAQTSGIQGGIGAGPAIIDITRGYNTGYISLINNGTFTGSGTNWDSTYGDTAASTTTTAAVSNTSGGNAGVNTFPQSNVVISVTSSSGFSAGQIACMFDSVDPSWQCAHVTAAGTGTITVDQMSYPLSSGSTVAAGGLTGYGFGMDADWVIPGNLNGFSVLLDNPPSGTIRQVFPIVSNASGNTLTIFAPSGVNQAINTRAYPSMGGSGGTASVTVSGGTVTGCTATGGTGYIGTNNPPQLAISGITFTTAPSIYVSGISGGALTSCAVANAGSGISGTATVAVTPQNGYHIYPQARVLNAYNATTGAVDGSSIQTTPAVGTFTSGDTLEQPHYDRVKISGLNMATANYQTGGQHSNLSINTYGSFGTNDYEGSFTNNNDPTLYYGYPAGAVPYMPGRGWLNTPYGLTLFGPHRDGLFMHLPPFGGNGGSSMGAVFVGCDTYPLGGSVCSQWNATYPVLGVANQNNSGNANDVWGYNPVTQIWSATAGATSMNGANPSCTFSFGPTGFTDTGSGCSTTGTGSLVKANSPTFTGNTTTFANAAAAELDVVIQPGLSADQVGAYGWNNYSGTSEWKLKKDASNYLRLTDAVNSLDREIFYQNGNTNLNAGAGANAVVLNGTASSGTSGLLVESGGSSPAAVLTVTGSGNTTATGFVSGKFMIGSGTMTLATGAAAGTSPTIACATSHVCDGVSGTATLTTGTSPTTGTLATLTFPNTHTNIANCIVDMLQSGVGRVTTATWTESTTAVTLTANTALTASTAYTVKYWCGGN
jgi:hypothetical protein